MNGWLIWKDYFVEWAYKGFASDKDLTFRPHFEITATHKKADVGVTFDNVVLKPRELKGVKNFIELPGQVQEMVLDQAVEALEKEKQRA